LQDAILGTLLVNEVVATHFGRALELSIDSPVSLFHAARIPGHIEMKQVSTVILEVYALACCVGGDHNS
jgi:hypothetical protein